MSLSSRIQKITDVAGTYQILLTDHVLDVNAAAAADLTLPLKPSKGQVFEVQDSSGNAATNNITILPPSGINLNGGPGGFVISSNYGRAVIHYNGAQYLAA